MKKLLIIALTLMVQAGIANDTSDVPMDANAGIAQTTTKVLINSADASEISKKLPGVGLKKAQAIVVFREQHGAFESVEDLQKVKGIGPKLTKKFASQLQF